MARNITSSGKKDYVIPCTEELDPVMVERLSDAQLIRTIMFILKSKIMEPGSEKATLVVFLKKGSLEVTVINERLPPGLAFIYVNSFVKSWGLKSRFVLP